MDVVSERIHPMREFFIGNKPRISKIYGFLLVSVINLKVLHPIRFQRLGDYICGCMYFCLIDILKIGVPGAPSYYWLLPYLVFPGPEITQSTMFLIKQGSKAEGNFIPRNSYFKPGHCI